MRAYTVMPTATAGLLKGRCPKAIKFRMSEKRPVVIGSQEATITQQRIFELKGPL